MIITVRMTKPTFILIEIRRVKFVHIRKAIIEHEKTGIAPEPFIKGHDLLDAGLRASPNLGDVLEAVYDAQLEGTVSGKDDALDLAKAIYSEIKDTQ